MVSWWAESAARVKASRRASSRSSRARNGLAMWKPRSPDWRAGAKVWRGRAGGLSLVGLRRDGGGDEDLGFVFAEALHDFFFFVAGEAAVQEAKLELGKNFARQALVFFHGGFQLELRFFDDGINDVALVAGCDFAAERFPNAGEMLFGGHARDDGRAPWRELIENGNVEVAIERERERARDGRGGEDEDVRGVAMGGGFVHQALALQDAKAVLLVNGDQAQADEGDVVFNQRVGADDELGFAGTDAI